MSPASLSASAAELAPPLPPAPLSAADAAEAPVVVLRRASCCLALAPIAPAPPRAAHTEATSWWEKKRRLWRSSALRSGWAGAEDEDEASAALSPPLPSPFPLEEALLKSLLLPRNFLKSDFWLLLESLSLTEEKNDEPWPFFLACLGEEWWSSWRRFQRSTALVT